MCVSPFMFRGAIRSVQVQSGDDEGVLMRQLNRNCLGKDRAAYRSSPHRDARTLGVRPSIYGRHREEVLFLKARIG